MNNSVTFDVLGLGCTAVDDLLYVPEYPPADAKVQIERHERQCGGLTATALVAAARLGARCAYAGILGDDELSQFVLERFRVEGIDTAHVIIQPGARPVHSVIIVDQGRQTRNIFYNLSGAGGAHPDLPAPEVIRSTRALLVDHFGVEGMTRATRIAQAAGIPVVADFERDDPPGFVALLALVDHVIVSRDFAAKLTGLSNPSQAAKALWTPDRQAVVVTAGAEGCWYLIHSRTDFKSVAHEPAFRVTTVDTTGCGDVFHGAYAAALARGLPLPNGVRFAAAAAALKATRRGGQLGIPNRASVEQFLKERAL